MLFSDLQASLHFVCNNLIEAQISFSIHNLKSSIHLFTQQGKQRSETVSPVGRYKYISHDSTLMTFFTVFDLLRHSSLHILNQTRSKAKDSWHSRQTFQKNNEVMVGLLNYGEGFPPLRCIENVAIIQK